MSLTDYVIPLVLIALGIGIVVFLGMNKKGSASTKSDSTADATEGGELTDD